MQAIIKTGGKQYNVSEDQFIRIERVAGNVGDLVNFEQVLLIRDENGAHIGSPILKGASVVAEIQFHGRADKVKILKFKRRKHHMKRAGHRQNFSQVKITKIVLKTEPKEDDPKAQSKKKSNEATAKDTINEV